jgi:hypothetical protein
LINRLKDQIWTRTQILRWTGTVWALCSGYDSGWSSNSVPTWGWGGEWNFSSASSPPCGEGYYRSNTAAYVTTPFGFEGSWFQPTEINWNLSIPLKASSLLAPAAPPGPFPEPGSMVPVLNSKGVVDSAAGLVQVSPPPPTSTAEAARVAPRWVAPGYTVIYPAPASSNS